MAVPRQCHVVNALPLTLNPTQTYPQPEPGPGVSLVGEEGLGRTLDHSTLVRVYCIGCIVKVHGSATNAHGTTMCNAQRKRVDDFRSETTRRGTIQATKKRSYADRKHAPERILSFLATTHAHDLSLVRVLLVGAGAVCYRMLRVHANVVFIRRRKNKAPALHVFFLSEERF